MAYVISSACIGRQSQASCFTDGGFPCVEVCPVDGIFSRVGDSQMYIDQLECIDCGACEAACPITAGVYVDYDNPIAAGANTRYFVGLTTI